MAYFILPDDRIVVGNILQRYDRSPLGDFDHKWFSSQAFTWEECQNWVLWQDSEEKGKTLLNDCVKLNVEGNSICASCESEAPCEEGDYLCIHCRYERLES